MLKPEHLLTGNVRLVRREDLPLALAAIKLLEAVESGEELLWIFQTMP